MSRGTKAAALAVVLAMSSSVAFADRSDPIRAYRVKATPKNVTKLAMAGFDVTEGRRGDQLEVYGTAGQLRKVRSSLGVRATLVKNSAARTRRVRARSAQAAPYTGSDAAYKVWRRYDRVPGDGKEQYLELYDRLAQRSIVDVEKVGETYLGRDILALKVTRGADDPDEPAKPAVLYTALQHAREWLAGETCRRSLLYFTDNYGSDEQVTRLVNSRELWFMCVANPDGYEYTFTDGNRLWRKNMADNDGDGIRGENGDGVDPNRNFPDHWGLDDEGSSSDLASETYRGPSAASEPETDAMLALFGKADFKFQKNDHTAAQLLLYPHGWQQYTWSADDPIFTALAGNDKKPAINTFDPDLGAELYITNGETTDTAYSRNGILSYTPEGTPAKDLSVSGFEYEDQEGAIEAEFNRHLPFTLDLAESAGDPEKPVSHLKNTVADFYPDAFAESFGDPQPVQVLAKRSLGDLVVRYRINGGATQEASATDAPEGERYGDPGVYFHRVRGTVTGTSPGDSVEVWFAQANGTKRSASFTYRAAAETGNRVLVMSAEDYSGPTPTQAPGPHFAQAYVNALAANGIAADLYDVDARGRKAPHPLGVLSHYDAVIWDTGEDYLTREPGQVPGTGTSRLAAEEEVAVRDYLNEGGKLLYIGKHAGQQYAEGFEFRNWGFPQPNESQQGRWCDSDLPESKDGCIAHVDDFLQYWLGAYLRVENGGSWRASDNTIFPVTGEDPFGPATWTFTPTGPTAGAGAPTATFGVTSSMIDRPAYQDSRRLAGWDRPGAGPFSPNTGDYYMATGHDDESYKRLSTQVDVPAGGGNLTFHTSYDLEDGWDFMFVEAHVLGTDPEQWTTLPDQNHHTTQATGDSCWTDGGWWQLHPRLVNYQTVSGESCTPAGTTGSWNAVTGSSGGWEEWSIDLTPYAGKTVELAIVAATDWAVGGLGAFVDDATITLGGSQASSTSFEDGTGVWQPSADPSWRRSTQVFEEGAVVGTPDSVYAGFELGNMATAEERASFMKEAMQHLGVLG